jgi:Flp pilus assembly protein TadG
MEIRVGTKATASPGVRVKARPRARQLPARDDRGQALLEFALVLVVLVLILLGIITFGIAFNNQITLTNAVNNAAQVVMTGPGVINDPCAAANTALANAAASLNNPNIYGSNPLSFSISAYTNTTTPNTTGPYNVVFSTSGGPTCPTEAADLTTGQEVVVSATYGCKLQFFGINFAPSCILSAQAAEAVQ